MSTHIGASPGQIAPTVLLPGDPLRAKWIAETFLEDATCYSEVRGMYGFSGTWRGRPVSVQGSGMGQPSMAIYVNELFREYDVQSIVRVGSCGSLVEKVALRDVVIASGACTNSSMNQQRFHGLDYAPVADFGLLRAAHDAAASRPDLATHVGLIFSTDSFYWPRAELMKPMVEHGVLAVDMEASALYTLAAAYGTWSLALAAGSRPWMSWGAGLLAGIAIVVRPNLAPLLAGPVGSETRPAKPAARPRMGRPATLSAVPSDRLADPSRRRWLKAAGAAAGAVAVDAFGLEPRWLEVTEHDVRVPGLPSALEGYTVAQLMVEVLKNCKDDLSRENILKQATNLNGLQLPMLLPGIKVHTEPGNVTPIRQIQMARFDGKSWALFGDVLGEK